MKIPKKKVVQSDWLEKQFLIFLDPQSLILRIPRCVYMVLQEYCWFCMRTGTRLCKVLRSTRLWQSHAWWRWTFLFVCFVSFYCLIIHLFLFLNPRQTKNNNNRNKKIFDSTRTRTNIIYCLSQQTLVQIIKPFEKMPSVS